MNTRVLLGITILLLAPGTQLFAQSSGSSVSLQYGTVKAVGEVQAESKHAADKQDEINATQLKAVST